MSMKHVKESVTQVRGLVRHGKDVTAKGLADAISKDVFEMAKLRGLSVYKLKMKQG